MTTDSADALKAVEEAARAARGTVADLAGVPAERMTGTAVLQDRGASYVEAASPVDSGTVRLRLLATNGRWLVDGVDWERS